MKKIILFAMLLCGMAAMAQNKLPVNLKGNWIDVKTGEWEYGFFDDFAIAASEFWDYELVGNERIVLTKNGVEMTLEVKPTKNGWEISRDGEKARRFEKGVPHYTTKDTKNFPEPDFMAGTAMLRGVLHGFDADSIEQVTAYVDDVVSDEQAEYSVDVDSRGRFELTVRLFGAQEVWLDFGDETTHLVLQPGECQLAFFEPDEPSIFMGGDARLNNEIAQLDERIFSSRPARKDVDGARLMDYLRLCENLYNQRTAYYNDFIKAHPRTSERFRFYQTNRMRFDLVWTLMQHRFQLMRDRGERFPEEYMAYIDAHMTLDEPRTYTLNSEFKDFLRDYLGYLVDGVQPASAQVTLQNIADLLDKEGKLTPEIRKYIDMVMEFADGKEMSDEDTAKLKEAGDFLNGNKDVTDAAMRYVKEAFEAPEQRVGDSLFTTRPILRQMMLASKYYKEIEGSRMPLSPEKLVEIDENIHNAYLHERLHEINDYFADLQTREVEHPESLRDAAELAGIDDPEELFARIIEPLKDKVVYIDIWGTWCGPCREAMKLMPDIKRRYADKDVVFLYLANNSPDEGWRSFIKETHLTGANVVHYNLPREQQTMLEKHFNVHKWPTYILVGRTGTVLDADAPAPLMGVDKVVKAIDTVLAR